MFYDIDTHDDNDGKHDDNDDDDDDVRGGLPPEQLDGGVWPASQIPFPYLRPKLRFSFPIYDLNENMILYLRPDP